MHMHVGSQLCVCFHTCTLDDDVCVCTTTDGTSIMHLCQCVCVFRHTLVCSCDVIVISNPMF